MPLHTESLPIDIDTRREFCLALKAARERRGITLAEIAQKTKIPASLFAGLERNDLRRWPTALFRRSFFRDYVRVVGLPIEETVAEFVRLFPETGVAGPAPITKKADEANEADDIRLMFDAAWHGPRGRIVVRLVATVLDAAVVIGGAFAIARLAGMDQLATIAGVSLTYFSVSTALLGQTPATSALSRTASIFEALKSAASTVATAPNRATDAISHAFASGDGDAHDHIEEAETPAWISDAHRVGPSRLRVRFRMPQ